MEELEHGVEILKWQLIMRKNQNYNREKELSNWFILTSFSAVNDSLLLVHKLIAS